MYLSICECGETEAAEALNIDPASLSSAFEQVSDGRKKKGKRYPLPSNKPIGGSKIGCMIGAMSP